jgi:predicted DNA-binding transcriptional regulator YafY
MAERVERLTNLLALLLETSAPLSLVEIAGELRGQYPEKEAARRGAFERDKSALREMGVPIEQEVVVGGPYAGSTKYWIDRARYELADLRLEPDEMRALQVAVAATRTGSELGQEAMWKLGSGPTNQFRRDRKPNRPRRSSERLRFRSEVLFRFCD